MQDKLHEELDENLGTEDEGLRLHSTSSLGLPRVAPFHLFIYLYPLAPA